MIEKIQEIHTMRGALNAQLQLEAGKQSALLQTIQVYLDHTLWLLTHRSDVLEAAADHLHNTDYEAAAAELRAWMRENL